MTSFSACWTSIEIVIISFFTLYALFHFLSLIYVYHNQMQSSRKNLKTKTTILYSLVVFKNILEYFRYFHIFYFADPRILNILVPHLGQVPLAALLFVLPLPFISTSETSFISLLALHFTQYASIVF